MNPLIQCHLFASVLLITFVWPVVVSGRAINYNYDTLNRLQGVSVSGGYRIDYTYDTAGNIVKKVVHPSSQGTVPERIATGLYQGLVQGSGGTIDNALLSLNVTSLGGFTGSLGIRGVSYKLLGTFKQGQDGVFVWNGTIHRTGQSSLIVSLRFDPCDPSGNITGTVSDNASSAIATLSKAGFSKTRPALLAGNYTVLIPANPDFPGVEYPQGDGFALLTIGIDGSVRLSGQLCDGTPISQSGKLTNDGRFPVYVPLYKGKGLLSGWIDFQPVNTVSDFNGTLEWTKAVLPGDAFYSAGFDCVVDIMGSRYTPPGATTKLLNLESKQGNAFVAIGEGNLSAPLSLGITIDSSSRASTAAAVPGSFSLSFVTTTGLFRGSFLHPAMAKKVGFTGVVFQKQNLGLGLFKGTDKAGYINILQSGTSFLLLPPRGDAP